MSSAEELLARDSIHAFIVVVIDARVLMMHLDDVYNHEMWSDRMKCHQRLVAYLLYRAL